jgi:hypothetical protein
MLQGQVGQPTHAQVHITLAQLRSLPGASDAEGRPGVPPLPVTTAG